MDGQCQKGRRKQKLHFCKLHQRFPKVKSKTRARFPVVRNINEQSGKCRRNGHFLRLAQEVVSIIHSLCNDQIDQFMCMLLRS